jgi:hypothetical protein
MPVSKEHAELWRQMLRDGFRKVAERLPEGQWDDFFALGVDDEPEVLPAKQEEKHKQEKVAAPDIGTAQAAKASSGPREEPQDHQYPEKESN